MVLLREIHRYTWISNWFMGTDRQTDRRTDKNVLKKIENTGPKIKTSPSEKNVLNLYFHGISRQHEK